MQRIEVKIKSDAWVKEANSYMNISPQFKTWFPDDCFIPRGTGKQHSSLLESRGIEMLYQGRHDCLKCFLELRDDGQFRPSNRGAIKEFYRFSNAQVGDTIIISKISERRFEVTLAAGEPSAVHDQGQES